MNRLSRAALAPFDPRGRLSAPAFRHVVIRLLLAFCGLVCLSIWLGALGLRWPAILVFGSTPLDGLAALAQASRRLHDRDRAGWWVGLYGLTEVVRLLPLEAAIDTHPLPAITLLAAMLGYFVWFWVETLLRPGTRGPNRYGPEPTEPSA